MHLTDLEKKLIVNIGRNNFADGDPTAPIWADCIHDNGPYEIKPASVGGGVASLVKKGLAVTNGGDGRDATTRLTPRGVEILDTL